MAIFYTPLRVRSSSASASAIADIAEEYTDDLKGIKFNVDSSASWPFLADQ